MKIELNRDRKENVIDMYIYVYGEREMDRWIETDTETSKDRWTDRQIGKWKDRSKGLLLFKALEK